MMRQRELLAPQQPVDRAPLLLGRPPAAGLALGRSGLRSGGWSSRCEILCDQPRRLRIAAPLGKSRDLQHAHRTIKCNRDDIARAHWLACRADAFSIETHMTGAH